jgi:hypothetical protein
MRAFRFARAAAFGLAAAGAVCLLHCSGSSSSSPDPGPTDAGPDTAPTHQPDASPPPPPPMPDAGIDASDASPPDASPPDASQPDTGPTCGAHLQTCCAAPAAACDTGLTCVNGSCASIVVTWTSSPLPMGFVPIGISGASATNVWVVGNDSTAFQGSAHQMRAQRWDGQAWNTIATDTTTHDATSVFVDVGGVAWVSTSGPGHVFSSDGTSAGWSDETDPSVTSTYTLFATRQHLWLGTQWNFGAGPLYELDGSTWNQITNVPNIDNQSSVGSIYAAGDDLFITHGTEIDHRSAGAWSALTWTAAANEYPGRLRGTSATDLWFTASVSGSRPTLNHYDGMTTKSVTLPSGANISDHAYVSPTDGWIVGTGTLLRWDGAAWKTPNGSGAPTSGRFVWTVGNDVYVVGDAIYHGVSSVQ